MHVPRAAGDPYGSPPSRMGFFHRFVYNCCNSISSCLYFACCCWLLQDCLRGPRDAFSPPPPPPPRPHGPPGGPGTIGPSAAPFDLPGPPGPPGPPGGILERPLL